MLNPSKARVEDDPTIRKCIGFAKRGGAGGFLVVNAMAYSATDPRDMVRAHRDGVNITGEHNAAAIRWACSRPALLGRHIGAWGCIPPRLREVAKRGLGTFKIHPFDCFGKNADGSPRHPLMLGYDTPLVPYAVAA